jgi:hypothetical protein
MTDNDTAPAIRSCLLQTLATRNPTHSFTTFSDPSTLHAAQAQDAIGWVHLTEGKLSRHWRHLQTTHYHSSASPRCPKKWAAGLITNLLLVTHTQWTHRNNTLHARNEQGLKISEGRELQTAIEAEFALGASDLHAHDQHYITRGLATVLALPATNKKAWLSGIRLARQSFEASAAREISSMQAVMQHWLTQP